MSSFYSFDKEKVLQSNSVIHCETEEQARVLLTYLDGLGFKWASKDSLIGKTCYSYCANKTAYLINPSGIKYCSYEWYKSRGKIIVNFKDTLVTKPKFEYPKRLQSALKKQLKTKG